MRKTLLFPFLILLTNISVGQKNITGVWAGKITPQLHLAFHFDHTADGSIFGTLDSPDQGVNGIPLTSVDIKEDSLFIDIENVKVRFNAKFTNDTMLTGVWQQGMARVPLVLNRQSTVSNISVPKRPQTPHAPFAYNSEDVAYYNADKSVHFGATLTFPKSGQHFATAILITGSGLQDRDETIFYHKPFAVIADYLTKNGYAVLRVDDRTMGKTTGDVMHATSADYANDVIAGIEYLKTRKEIDPAKIGLIGHSEGGFIAPMVFSQWPHLAFIISLAGTGVSGAEILLKQQTDPLKDMGLSPAAFNSYYSLTKTKLSIIHDSPGQPDSVLLKKIASAYEQWKAGLPDSIANVLHTKAVSGDQFAQQNAGELLPWLRYFITTEPALFWSKVKCPVLALNGSKDIQVYPDQNTTAIAEALQKAGNKKVTIKIFPGLNHLFQHCINCTVDEYKSLEETFAPEVLEEMQTWLKKQVK